MRSHGGDVYRRNFAGTPLCSGAAITNQHALHHHQSEHALALYDKYTSAAWDPHLAKDKDSPERIQRRAARWITGTYDQKTSVTALLQQLKLEPLEERRRVNRLAFVYKILNEHVAVAPDKMDLILNTRPAVTDDVNQSIIKHKNTTA